jgi:outer membrane lipoprotein-sorting protein
MTTTVPTTMAAATSPLPPAGEGGTHRRGRWEGEGARPGKTLTRPGVARRATLSRGAGEGIAALVLLFLLVFASLAKAQTAQEIIAASDKVRNPGEPFRLTNTLTEYVSGKARDQNVLVVFSKEDKTTGQFRNLVRYSEPPRDAGKMVLLFGTKLWFYDPASKASVRISPQQRLIGQAAIGDVLTANFAIDYRGTLLGIDKILDSGKQEHTCWHLDMKAATEEATYARVEYWIEQESYYPIKARFYSDSGRALKILYYRSFQSVLGKIRPTEAIIIDAVDSNLVTLLKFDDYRFTEIPDAWFQRDYLPHLKVN